MVIWDWIRGRRKPAAVSPRRVATAFNQAWSGDKFSGGWGDTKIYNTFDYGELRDRSRQLFRDNIYARGLIRRLVTNEINTGLTMEAFPYGPMLSGNPSDEELSAWSERVENTFDLWAHDPQQCDYSGRKNFGEIQRQARRQSLVEGDVLVVLHLDARTGSPRIQLISARSVRSPMGVPEGTKIMHGVELGTRGEHVAFWVADDAGHETRIPAYGVGSGRRMAWLVYGSDMLVDEVRGEPFLSIMLQSLRDLDRYKDSAQRKALLNAILALFVEKSEDKPGSRPLSLGATKSTPQSVIDDGAPRTFGMTQYIPGMYIEELQTGEKITPHSTAGTDVNLGPFEQTIIQALAWCAEIPPEVAQLSFNSNYSASQAAINEFRMYLDMRRENFGGVFCEPIKEEWLLAEHFAGRLSTPGFLESYLDPSKRVEYRAWNRGEWTGPVKPSTDMLKMAKGLELLVSHGWETNARAARVATGSKFETNVARIKHERDLMRAAGMLVEEEGNTDAVATE